MAARPGPIRPVQLTEPDIAPFVPSSSSPDVACCALRPPPRAAGPETHGVAGITVRALLLLLVQVLLALEMLQAGARVARVVAAGAVAVVEAAAATAVGAAAVGADALDEAVEDDELDLELDAVDAGLEGALEVEEAGGLDAEQRGVQRDDQQVGVDQVPQHLLRVARGRGRGRERRGPEAADAGRLARRQHRRRRVRLVQ